MALIDDILAQLAIAASAAQGNRTDAQTHATAATMATNTTPQCREGLTELDAARQAAELAHDQAGRAQSLFGALSLSTLIPPPTSAQLTTATAQRTSALQAAADADAAVALAEPVVIAAHDQCILSSVISGLVACVNSGVAAATNATHNIGDPHGGPAANLDVIVQRLISAAGNASPSPAGTCNEGVQLLADAANLLSAQTGAANLPQLKGCLDQLTLASPGNPALAAGQAAQTGAKTIIDHAGALLNDMASSAIRQAWRKRIVCATPKATIRVHVTDESGDDFGSGASVSLVNFPLNALLPELPSVPTGATNGAGRVDLTDVPLAPAPLPLPAGTPPAPPDLPMTDAATLLVQVRTPGKADGNGAAGASHAGLIAAVEIHVPIDDSSL